MFFIMKNRRAMYEISIKIVFQFCMFYNMVLWSIEFQALEGELNPNSSVLLESLFRAGSFYF